MTPISAVLCGFFVLAIPPGAMAQISSPSCSFTPPKDDKAEDHMTQVAPLWIANGTEGPLTLRRLAELGAPILWFSPQEFLLQEAGSETPPLGTPIDSAHMLVHKPMVYYRIREVRLKKPASGAQMLQLGEHAGDVVRASVQNVEQPWGCAGSSLPIEELDQVAIRYFFYYAVDRGIGGHNHDLEALELRLRVKPVCLEGGFGPACFQAVQLETASGSAHGVGWYTNVLDVTRAPDTQVPLTVLVEENKHASSPDRDGDGLYMPHYDINRFSNDGWGIRDVAGTGKLGSPAYSADQSRALRATHSEYRALPPTDYWSLRLRGSFHTAEIIAKRPTLAPDSLQAGWTYQLEGGWRSQVCSATGDVNEAKARALITTDNGDKFIELTKKLTFCQTPAATHVYPSSIARTQRVADLASLVFPGPRKQYGFMSWPQRMSASYRHDRGNGASYIGPFLPGFEMPIFGGWVVTKFNVTLENVRTRNLGALSLEGMYMPSASQSVTWYVAVGEEWRHFDIGDKTRGIAEEFGVKFRFSLEKFKIVKFYGARLGIRALGLDPMREPRLVFEVGAGSW